MYLVKFFVVVIHELNYQLNMNVDTCDTDNLYLYKLCNMDLFDPAHEMPTLIFCALFHHDRGWENESILGRIGGYIFC